MALLPFCALPIPSAPTPYTPSCFKSIYSQRTVISWHIREFHGRPQLGSLYLTWLRACPVQRAFLEYLSETVRGNCFISEMSGAVDKHLGKNRLTEELKRTGSLTVQWLRLHALTAKREFNSWSSTLGWGTKIPQAAEHRKKTKTHKTSKEKLEDETSTDSFEKLWQTPGVGIEKMIVHV